MNIELRYFEDCPSWQTAFSNLKTALIEENLDAQIHLVKIENAEEAKNQHFLGSPSIHIGSEDLWPEDREDYFLGCRIYQTPDGLKGWPTVEMIRQKLSTIKHRGMK